MEQTELKQSAKEQTVITVKIPKEMKKKMKQIDVNWSEYIREMRSKENVKKK